MNGFDDDARCSIESRREEKRERGTHPAVEEMRAKERAIVVVVRSFVRSRVDMTTDRTVMKTVEGVSPMDIDLMANACLSYGDARHLHTLYV